ncbi:MAG: hypothetical protein WAU70_03300 [Flavobacteriales bacterium]
MRRRTYRRLHAMRQLAWWQKVLLFAGILFALAALDLLMSGYT